MNNPVLPSKKNLLGIAQKWQEQLNVKPNRIQIRKMKNKWGSHSSKGNITLSFELTKLPNELAEYTVLHELLHTIVPDHGRKFKAMLSALMPDWEDRQTKLKALPRVKGIDQTRISRNQGETDAETVWYFAYGSNLNKRQMRDRVGDWKESRRAHLKGWKLLFNVPSGKWDGGAANIVKTDDPHAVVYGAIYLLTPRQLETLTKHEGVPPKPVQVKSEGTGTEAKVYIFKKNNPTLKPASKYLNRIISGLKDHGYPDNIIKDLKERAKSNGARI